MKIAIPMAGMGKRFVEAGYTVPKPLLPFQGKSLVYWAVESTKLLQGTYEYLPSHTASVTAQEGWGLPPGCWHVVSENTTGPLQTLLHAKECLDTEDELLIMDCDSIIDTEELATAIFLFRHLHVAGGVTLRRTQDPMCSYAMVDSEWWVQETREKEVISPWSTTGPYWFASGKVFLQATEKAMRASHTSVSPVYNYLYPGARVKGVPVSSFRHLGTPEEYEALTNLCVSPRPDG